MDEATEQQIEQITGYKFANKKLLAKAFTHSSAVDNRILSNERLEFLGDAVLALVVCQALFERFPGYLEGDLTKVKSMLVSRGTCARLAKNLRLQKFLKIGKGMTSTRALSGSIAAGVLEALIAAIYLDGGSTKIDGELGAWLKYYYQGERAGMRADMYSLMYLLFYNDKMLSIQCSVSGVADDKEIMKDAFASYLPLFVL